MSIMSISNDLSIPDLVKSYQTASAGSLKGPESFFPRWTGRSDIDSQEVRKALAIALAFRSKNYENQKPDTSEQFRSPLFMTVDTTPATLTQVDLEGHSIACFEKGGEKRLCLPQVLSTVLSGLCEEEVHRACDKLQIFFSKCMPQELEILKQRRLIPMRVQGSGLLTLSDAERLCSYLLNDGVQKETKHSDDSFYVYHECFGFCKGLLIPDQYTSTAAPCIKCDECSKLFSPEQFVRHVHTSMEHRTCHWGFSSKRWRNYLAVDDENEHGRETMSRFEDMKRKFLRPAHKRPADKGSLVVPILPKVARLDPRPSSPVTLDDLKRLQQSGTPKLLDPHKVVLFSEKDKYAKNYVPNVSLAPKSTSGTDDLEDDEEDLMDVESDQCGTRLGLPTLYRNQALGPAPSVSSQTLGLSCVNVTLLSELVSRLPQDEDGVRDELMDLCDAARKGYLDSRREVSRLTAALDIKQQELEAERASLNRALHENSHVNKALWQDIANMKEQHSQESSQLAQECQRLREYISDCIEERDRYKQTTALLQADNTYKSEQLAVSEHRLHLCLEEIALLKSQLPTSPPPTPEASGRKHEHYLKKFIGRLAQAN